MKAWSAKLATMGTTDEMATPKARIQMMTKVTTTPVDKGLASSLRNSLCNSRKRGMASTRIVAPPKVHCNQVGTVPNIPQNSGSMPKPTNAEPKPNTVAPNDRPKAISTQSSIEPTTKAMKPSSEKKQIFTKVERHPLALR